MFKISPASSPLGASLLACQMLIIFAMAAPLQIGPEAERWCQRRSEFYKNTTFELPEFNVRLIGGKFSSVRTGHLPFWFDYQLFKQAFNKSNANPDEGLARNHLYISNCVRTLKARTLFRMLAGTHDSYITADADLVSSRPPPEPL